MIYAVWAEGTPYIKIGWVNRANWMKKRLSIMQVGCPHALQLIAQIEGTVDEEQAIHMMLQGSLHRGEWFELNTDVKLVLALMEQGKPLKDWDLNQAAGTRMRRVLFWAKTDPVREIRIHHKNRGYRWKLEHGKRLSDAAGTTRALQPDKGAS